jgi:transposase-like protein
MAYIPLSQIVDLYQKEKLSASEVARRLGVSRQAISSRLKLGGIPTRKSPKVEVLFDRSTLVRLYEQNGLTIDEVAKELQSTRAKILRSMDVHRIQRRRRGRRIEKHSRRQ